MAAINPLLDPSMLFPEAPEIARTSLRARAFNTLRIRLAIARETPDALKIRYPDLLHKAAQLKNRASIERVFATGLYGLNDLFEGDAPLHLAAKIGNIDAVTTLIELGADINVKTDELEETPLLLASEVGCLEVVEKLISAGAKPLPDIEGRTPMMALIRRSYLCRFNPAQMLMVLIAAGDCDFPSIRKPLEELRRTQLLTPNRVARLDWIQERLDELAFYYKEPRKLAFLLADQGPQDGECKVHSAYFRSIMYDKNLSRLILELAGLD